MSRLKVDTITNLSGGAVDLPGFEGGGGGGTVTPQKVAILADAKPSGTSGGASVAGWQDRTLNTIVSDDYNLVTLTNNTEFTLTAGTYLIEWSTPGYRANGFTSKLTNVTAGSTQQMGSIEYSDSFDYFATVDSTGAARVVITENTTYKIELNVQTANAFGLGDGRYNTGDDNIFTQVTITDLSVVGGGGGGGGGGTTKANIYGTAKAYASSGDPNGVNSGVSLPFATARNIASIIKGPGIGLYDITFTTPMLNDDYIVNCSNSASGTVIAFTLKTVNGFRFKCNKASGAVNPEFFDFTVFDNEPAEIVVGSGTVANTNIYGTAKAWGSFNATGATISATNLSATSPSAGIYFVSFGTAMADNKYTVVATSSYNPNNVVTDCITANKTTTGFTVYVNQSISGASQFNNFDIAVYDDQPAEIALTTFGDVINYSGAAAWGKIASDSTIESGLNISNVTTSTDSGNVGYDITFTTPMPSANYAVNGTSFNSLRTVIIKTQDASGFRLELRNQSNNGVLEDFSFTVFSTNSLLPKGGTGTDAWGSVDDTTVNGACNVPASFNVASVTRTTTGTYDVVFTTPMPTANYCVNATVTRYTYGAARPVNKTVNGFTVNTVFNNNGPVAPSDYPFDFTVNATNATLPQSFTTEQIDAAINNPGASAWGNVAADGTLNNGMNTSQIDKMSVTDSTDLGIYKVYFTTPMPDSNYSVVGSTDSASYNNFSVGQKTANWFIAYTTFINVTDSSVRYSDQPFNYAVFATNSLPPKGGTGTDSWVTCESNGDILASFNTASVTRTSTGIFDVAFATPMPTARYAVNVTSANSNCTTACYGFTTAGYTVAFRNQSSGSNLVDTSFSTSVNATNATLPTTFTEAQIQGVIDAKPQGIAKAWVNFDGNVSPITIRSGLNVNSITDVNTGEYTINFTTPFADDNYAFSVSRNRNSNDSAIVVTVKTSSSISVRTVSETFQGLDVTECSVIIFAD